MLDDCRDAAIQLATEMFAAKKAELRQLRSALDSQAKFMDNEQANNTEVEARIDHMERQVHKLRDAFAAEQHALSEAADEVEIMRNTLNKTGGELAAVRGLMAEGEMALGVICTTSSICPGVSDGDILLACLVFSMLSKLVMLA